MNKMGSIFMIALMVLNTSSCSLTEGLGQHKDKSIQQFDHVASNLDTFKRSSQTRPLTEGAQYVNKPWLAGKPVAVSREVTLPQALRRNIDTTLMFGNENANLVTLGQRIAVATEIPVTIMPDATLPAESFAPRLSGNHVNSVVILPVETSFLRGPQPLPKILDTLSKRLNVLWKYEDGAIVFYRTLTKAFDVRLLTMSAATEMSLGRSASPKSGGFDNSARTTFRSSDLSPLDAIKTKIEPFMTRAGVIATQAGAASTIVVTDTPWSLKKIGLFIENENRALTRRVRLVFEEITVETDDDLGMGVDWETAFATEKLMSTLVSSGVGLATESAKSLAKMNLSGQSPAKLVVQALSRQGRILRHTTVPIVTLNRRPVTHAVRTTFSYIDQVKTVALNGQSANGQGLPSVSVSQKEETVGAFLTILPDAHEDGQIMLSIAYDNTVAQPVKTISFGGSNQKLDIQQVVVDGNGTVQQLVLKSGYPMLISGFERRHSQSEQSRSIPDMPILAGGSDRLSQSKIVTMIVLTAHLEEGM